MRFAMIENVRTEAQPGLLGQCPACSAPMIAKCGEQRTWHWSHKGARLCDPWWEPETDWHRAWKNRFPAEWQESIQHDHAGEKHIADVRTSHGLVLEFQHSRLDPVERRSREAFHGNMVWIVDGLRLKRDLPRFQKAIRDFRNTLTPGTFRLYFPEEYFPADWLDSSVPVLFDFDGLPGQSLSDTALWCLLPGRAENAAIVMCIRRSEVIKLATEKPLLMDAARIVSAVARSLQPSKPQINPALLDQLLLQRMRYLQPRRSRRF